MLTTLIKKYFDKVQVVLTTALLTLGIAHSVFAQSSLSQSPLFVAQPVRPIMMLNMSNDHQLFFKLYNDYTDLDPDEDNGVETTYSHSYDYYGYFDSNKCYTYNNSRFEPAASATNKYCETNSQHWSGNFLNWATMTRIDAVRKILYGGFRSTDEASLTVLERAMLPNDAHSFTKYYAGDDLNQLTPFTSESGATDPKARGVTICNTTDPTSRAVLSQNVTAPPLMRVARGNFSLWASNEQWQCRWGTGSNGNNSALSGIDAYSYSPTKDTNQLGSGDYNVRVKVCDENFLTVENDEKCAAYEGGGRKPKGLLQFWGETDSIHFGLITGSYGKNKSGGVLRKNAGTITDEINSDGTFKVPANGHSIIETLDLLKIYGYRFSDGNYSSGKHEIDTTNKSDGCKWITEEFDDGHCSNWGNPQAEIFLESLRYLAGKEPVFATDDSGYIDGLNTASWVPPVTNANYCAPLNVLQFNASISSFDGDALQAHTSDIGLANLNAATDAIGVAEGIQGSQVFIGEDGLVTTSDKADYQLCSAKNVTGLSKLLGTCPDAPSLKGSYQIAGLAYHARKTFIEGREKVKTFGVSLAPVVPKVSITAPVTGKVVTILPACQETRLNPAGACAIIDFKILEQEDTGDTKSGSLYVNWESNEHGGDFDQDMWGVIKYKVTSGQVEVTTQVMAQSTGGVMGFGYVIGGTETDGYRVHSGINKYTYPAKDGFAGCTGETCTCHANGGTQVCNLSLPTTQTYTLKTSLVKTLEQPLYYAAKWGGYATDNMTPEAIASSEAETYFFATDPRKLEEGLNKAFGAAAASTGSASAVATNSTRLGTDTLVYQARFNTVDKISDETNTTSESTVWSGQLVAYSINEDGDLNTTTPKWSTDTTLQRTGRDIYTYNGSDTVVFDWDNLSLAQQTALIDGDTEEIGRRRVDWLLGSSANENITGGMRKREKVLGDIVNSDPAYSGGSMRYEKLPAEVGGDTYENYINNTKSKTPIVYVGANDGMLHAFNALTGKEVFAYIPASVYSKLARITRPNYGRSDNPHQYLVDGSLYVSDAYINGSWKTILVGTLGAGGKGVFGLDVTNPNSPKVLFEFNGDDPLFANAMSLGYVLGQPLIVPMKNNKWMAVFGNGYHSQGGTSKLFIVNLETPANTYILDTKAGAGLSAPALLPNANGLVEYAYAGDLSGNMWKFDLSATSTNSWGVAFKAGSVYDPLFKAIDRNGVTQPITAAPTLGFNSIRKDNAGASSIMVYVGTGRYLYDGDNMPSAVPEQSFYGIADAGDNVTFTAGTRNTILHKKTIASQTAEKRTIAGDATPLETGTTTVDWENKSGWFLDFTPSTSQIGERVISKALLLYDRLLFPTFIPSNNVCDFGGSSWLMELTAVGDRYIGHSILGDSGIYLDEAVISVSDIIRAGEKVYIPLSNLKGDISIKEGALPKAATGRMSWRQLR